MHEIYILPKNAPQDNNETQTGTDKDQQVVYMLMSMKQLMDSQQAVQWEKVESQKPGFRNLIADTQQLILNASAVLPFEYVLVEQTIFLQKFLKEKTAAKAKIIQQKIFKKEKVVFTPSQGLVMVIHTGMFLWDTPDFPPNLSIFFCEWPQLMDFSSTQAKQLHMKVTEGQGLAEADIPKAVKQSMRVPKIYFEALSMVRNFQELLSLLVRPDSSAAEGVRTWIQHMLENELN